MALQMRNNELVAAWTVPTRGTLRGTPIYEVPEDAVWDALNVNVRDGRLVPRPGLQLFAQKVLMDRVTGGINTTSLSGPAFQDDAFQSDAFQVAGNDPSTTIVVATRSKIWAYRAGTWIDISDAPLLAKPNDLARFTSIEIAGEQLVLHTNGVDAPKVWNGSDPTVSVVSGSPPSFKDWTTIADHVIGIVPPFTVRWCNNLDISTWPALNQMALAQTPDPVVAIRALTSRTGALYKARSVWPIHFQGGSEARAFVADDRGGYFEGPASPSAVVDLDGMHAYMTNLGRPALFDGYSHRWICDGIHPLLDATLDRDYTDRIFGVYNPLHREVYFYYPMKGDFGDIRGKVLIVLPRPEHRITEPIAFVGRMGFPVSAAVDLRHFDNSVLLFRSDVGQERAYTVEGDDDAGTPISGFWQQGLMGAPNISPHRLTAIETLAYRGEGHGSLTIKPVSSFLLENEGGTIHPDEIFVDLTDVKPADPKGADVRGSFFSLRHEFTTPVTLRWMGAKLAARKVE